MPDGESEGTATGKPADTGDATGTNGGTAAGTITLTEAELQERIEASLKERLERAKKHADEKAEKARKDAEARTLAEQGEFKTLAEKAQARVAELEPKEKENEELRAVVEELLTARLKALTPEAKKAIENLPGEPGPVERLRWLTANEALFAKPAPTKGNAGNGTNQNGAAAGGMNEYIRAAAGRK